MLDAARGFHWCRAISQNRSVGRTIGLLDWGGWLAHVRLFNFIKMSLGGARAHTSLFWIYYCKGGGRRETGERGLFVVSSPIQSFFFFSVGRPAIYKTLSVLVRHPKSLLPAIHSAGVDDVDEIEKSLRFHPDACQPTTRSISSR